MSWCSRPKTLVPPGWCARYLPLAELADRTARQLDERRAATGKWEPNPELVAAIRAYVPEFAASEDAQTELGASGDLAGDDVRVYGRELFDAECLAATAWRSC